MRINYLMSESNTSSLSFEQDFTEAISEYSSSGRVCQFFGILSLVIALCLYDFIDLNKQNKGFNLAKKSIKIMNRGWLEKSEKL